MSGSGQEDLLDVLGEVGSHYQRPERIGSPSQKFGRRRKSLPDVWEWSRGPPRCLVVFRHPPVCPEVV